jgi:hypothetical protein
MRSTKVNEPLYVDVTDCFLVPNSYERYQFAVETLSRVYGFSLTKDGEIHVDSWYLYDVSPRYREPVLAAARERLKHARQSPYILGNFIDPFATTVPCWQGMDWNDPLSARRKRI